MITKTDLFVYQVTILSAVSGFLLGYDTGIVSGAMVFVRDYFQLDDNWHQYIVSVTILAAALLSWPSGYLTDKFGRKPIIILTCVIFTPGSILLGAAWDRWSLLVGRFLVGAAIGLSAMTVPIYIAELAPVNIRGKLVVLNQVLVFFGQFFAALLAAIMSSLPPDTNWRWMLGVAGIPSALQLIGFLFTPESPRWLIKQGRVDEAEVVLNKIREADLVEDELKDIIKEVEERKRIDEIQQSNHILEILRNSRIRRALLIGCGMWFIHQFTGINTIMYYCATIIQMSGLYDKNQIVWIAVAPATVSFLASLIAIFFVERLGRRKLTLISLTGVIASLVVIAVGFQIADKQTPMVGFHPDGAGECAQYDKCLSCVANSRCGFCFDKTTDNNFGGCFKIKEDDNGFITNSSCKADDNSGGYIWAPDWCPVDTFSWTILIGLMLYLCFFAIGMAPMPWAVNSEIYPLWARSACQSTAMTVDWVSCFIVSATFLTLANAITKYGAFYLYAAIGVGGFIFLACLLPETKGVNLEDVETLFLTKKERNKIVATLNEKQPVTVLY